MKHRFLTFLFMISCLGLFSCSDNDNVEWPDGGLRPSKITVGDSKIKFSYDEFYRIKEVEEGHSLWKYSYEGDFMTGATHHITDPEIADGAVMVNFKKEGNQIIVEHIWEPDFRVFQTIMEIAGQRPVKITDGGIYAHTIEGFIQEEEGEIYSVYTYNSPDGQLAKVETYNLADSTLVETTEYTYDQSPGTMSLVNLPRWFSIYWCAYRHTGDRIQGIQYLNYATNIIKKTVTDHVAQTTNVTEYTYQYNSHGLPERISSNKQDQGVSIRY